LDKKPLEDIVVLDLTRVLAGPFCTMLLADLGAEIIKVERPEIGDDARHYGPFLKGKSVYFISLNRGKKSIVLDLKKEKDRKRLLGMLPGVDVLVENFKPRTMDRLGFGYENLREINPGLVYASSSGYGYSGPESGKAAYDMIVQGRSGIMSITGEPDGPPVRVGMSIGDINAALFTALGISTALFARERTGKGQRVDVAMFDSMVAILENAIARYFVDGKPPGPLGTRHPSITPFEAFRAKDDWVIIAIGNDKLWCRFCRTMGREDLIEDPRFRTNALRTDNYRELKPILDELIGRYPAAKLRTLLEENGIPNGSIDSVDKLFSDLQLEARNMLVDIMDPDLGPVKAAGNPIKISSLPDSNQRSAAPELGEHTAEILKRFGLE